MRHVQQIEDSVPVMDYVTAQPDSNSAQRKYRNIKRKPWISVQSIPSERVPRMCSQDQPAR